MESIPSLTGSFGSSSNFGGSGKFVTATSGSTMVTATTSGSFAPLANSTNTSAANNNVSTGNNTARVKCALTPLKSNTANGGKTMQLNDSEMNGGMMGLEAVPGCAPVPKLKKKKKISRTTLLAENNALYEALALACSKLSIADRNMMIDEVKGRTRNGRRTGGGGRDKHGPLFFGDDDEEDDEAAGAPMDIEHDSSFAVAEQEVSLLNHIDVYRLQSRITDLDDTFKMTTAPSKRTQSSKHTTSSGGDVAAAPMRKSSIMTMGDVLVAKKKDYSGIDRLIESSDEDDDDMGAAHKASLRFGGDAPPLGGSDIFADTIASRGGRVTTHRTFDLGLGQPIVPLAAGAPLNSTITPAEAPLDDEAMSKPASEFVQPVSPAPAALNWRRRRRFSAQQSPSAARFSLGAGMSPAAARPGAPIIELQDSIAKGRNTQRGSRGGSKKKSKKDKKQRKKDKNALGVDDERLPIARRVSFQSFAEEQQHHHHDDNEAAENVDGASPMDTAATLQRRGSMSSKAVLPSVGTPFHHPGTQEAGFDIAPSPAVACTEEQTGSGISIVSYGDTERVLLDGLVCMDEEDGSPPRRVRNLLTSNLPSAPSEEEFASPHTNDDGGVTNSSVSQSSTEKTLHDMSAGISPPQEGAVAAAMMMAPPTSSSSEPLAPDAGLRPVQSFTRRGGH